MDADDSQEFRGQKGRAAYERKSKEKDAVNIEKKLNLANLYRCTLKKDFCISSGSIQPTRLKMLSNNECIISSENRLYHVKIDMLASTPSLVESGTQGINISRPIPVSCNNLSFCELENNDNTSSYEIQSIDTKTNSSGENVIVSIDNRGNGRLHRFSSFDNNKLQEDQIYNKKRRVEFSSRLSTFSLGEQNKFVESSWAGVALNKNCLTVSTVHSFSKTLQFYDLTTMKLTRKVSANVYPTAITYFNDSSLLLCSESNQLTVRDVREKSKNGCIVREIPSRSSCIYSIACSLDDRSVVVGGQDKIVYVYDPRTWRVRTRWKCPLKYDILSLNLSSSHKDLCYVGGLDNELMCGEYSTEGKQRPTPSKPGPSVLQQNHRLGFRGDSRWTGISSYLYENHDILMGICESGSIYLVDHAERMADNFNCNL